MVINGIGASDGYAIGKIYKYEQIKLDVKKIEVNNIVEEVEKLNNAIAQSKKELEIIKEKTRANIDDEHAAIFEAHIDILQDPELIGTIKSKIEEEKVNADYALKEVTDMFVTMFEAMDNEYIRERAADIKDVSKRLLMNLLGIKGQDPSAIAEEVIVVAEDLTPSDTAQLNKSLIQGFVTNIGGRTSHSAIMARTLEIPAIVGTKNAFEKIDNEAVIILDGFTGEIFVNPNEEMIEEYKEKQKAFAEQKSYLLKFKDVATKTKDGFHVELAANIGSPEDVEGVLNNGGEGIGLYRTEFLYMGKSDFPTEEEQFEAYKTVLEKMNGKPVVVRTLDIGGDKELSYLKMEHELNPFLGNRAVRLCMNNKDIFKTQLRALLRASIYGNLKIMFPMIAEINEFLSVKEFLLSVKDELVKEGIEISNTFELGIMIEIPAAAILADEFAKEVDFFSIGTNDLIQYTFAADRMNEKVSYLYQPYNPSLIRLIKMVIDAAHKEGKWVGMCGEMAGEELAVPILLGLGLDEFSMSATSILKSRNLLSMIERSEAIEISEKALKMRSDKDVRDMAKKYVDNCKKM